MSAPDLDAVFHFIVHDFTDAQRDRLMDLLVGRVPGWRIAEARISPRPCQERDSEWVRLNDNGLSYADIAHAFGVPRSTVSSACLRYRQNSTR